MSELGITAFDIAVVAVVLVSAALALARGFVREIMSLLSWIGAAVAAFFIYGEMEPLMAEIMGPGLLVQLLTGLIVFVVPLILFRVLTGMLANAVAGMGLGALDRLLGLGFGAARGALIVCAAYLVAATFVVPGSFPAAVQNAALQPSVAQGAAWIEQQMPRRLAEDGRATVEGALGQARREREGEPGYPARSREQLDRAFEEIR